MPSVNRKMDGDAQTVNSVFEVGVMVTSSDPGDELLGVGPSLLTEVVPKPPPLTLCPLMGTLCPSAICHSASSTASH